MINSMKYKTSSEFANDVEILLNFIEKNKLYQANEQNLDLKTLKSRLENLVDEASDKYISALSKFISMVQLAKNLKAKYIYFIPKENKDNVYNKWLFEYQRNHPFGFCFHYDRVFDILVMYEYFIS